jgi:hypothetical protein
LPEKPVSFSRPPGKSVERITASRQEYEVVIGGRQKLEDAKLRRAKALAKKCELEVQELRASLIPRS